MAHRPFASNLRFTVLCLLFAFGTLSASDAHAYINQSDGAVVPQTSRLQACLDLPATAEATAGAVNAIADAAVLPEAYRPVFDAVSGHYRVTFVDIGEGGGFRNSLGWFWIGTDITDPANLHTVFGCRTYATCDCPCTTTRTVTVDFETQSGFSAGRPIGLWLRTPERLDASREDGAFSTAGCGMAVGCDPAGANVNDSCGGRLDTNNRIYFTSAALNDDGDFVHFLVYRSASRTNTFYFGFEDLYRGGDNDYEDMLVRATGLVPECDPRPEICNGVDDDCDLVVDDGLTRPCSTLCGAGVETCRAGAYDTCSARVPSPETCNNRDDDCDTSLDEGLSRACSNSCGAGTEICIAGTFAMCSARTPTIESCNTIDDDCDSRTDEGLSRACSSDCGAGTEVCMGGTFGACSAPAPAAETCNAGDDDCDGRVDEALVRGCSSACGSGMERCVAGSFVECSAADPGIEACNGIDDDCDSLVDEGLTQACSSACGVGTEMCAAGAWVGCDAPGPSAETCNGLDDDCDGAIDDGNPGGGAMCSSLPDGGFDMGGLDGGVPTGDGGIVCMNGRVACVDGALTCRGSSSGSREVCNCLDDDCDGNVDEEAAGTSLCGERAACIPDECACRDACASDEFPCPPGRICDRALEDPSMGIIGYCVEGRCAGVTCGEEEVCDPETGACENLCEGITCGGGYACVRGACVEDNCYGRGCPTGEVCRSPIAGAPSCVANPCVDVACTGVEYCLDGACVAPCVDGCAADEICVDGACNTDPCGGTCIVGQSCVDARCVANNCVGGCGRGRTCRGSTCVDDPCASVRCPDGLECAMGACTRLGDGPPPDAVRGIASGGGCICAAAGAPSGANGPGALALATLLVLGIAWRARRRTNDARGAGARARRGVAVAIATSAMLAGGCDVDPYCFTNCGEDGGVVADAGPDAGTVTTDGCIASGEETCNDRDDDCNGRVDEGFDTSTDPANCGACGTLCMLPHAFPGCSASECVVDRCEVGWHDIDGVPSNGCEYGCPPSGDELCDTLDNDCDTTVDEGFDLTDDIANCGSCGTLCAFNNASASCVASACVMGGCRTGYVDRDADPSNGCEYRCTATGAETCNGVDDDCDLGIDEGFDLAGDPSNCGVCGRACAFPHVGMPRCTMGSCGYGPADCEPGYYDVDGARSTGCEYMCAPSAGADDCDRVDDDCDGRVDEADPMVGTACGTPTGACAPGTFACVRGALTCAGGINAAAEICNAIDDDCDGRSDESTAAAPIVGVGDRCGATDVGRCAYGQVQCSAGGALVCGGTIVTATAETCNGMDDNCNGALDDGLTPPARSTVTSCAETRGVCGLRTPTCRGAAGWACDLPATYQATETRCDGLDNDCNGVVDQGCLAPTGADVRVDSQDAASTANSLDPFIIGTGTGSSTRLHVAWRDLTGGGRTHTWTARSLNEGVAWGAPVQVDTTVTGGTFAPELALPGATSALWVWPDFRGGTGYREIFSRRSSTAGSATMTFSTEVKVNALGATSTTDSYNVTLASVGANVFATFEAFTGTRQRHVFFSRSTDSGATWSTPTQLSTPTGASFVAAEPRVAASGTNVYVVWRDNRSGSLDVYLRRSNNSGSTFQSEQRMDTGTLLGSSSSFSARVAANAAGAWVVWVDDRDMGSFDIWMNRTTDSGATWLTGAVQLDQDPLRHDSIEPLVIAPVAGSVNVSWIDYRAGFPDVFTTRSTTGGSTWSTPERLDTGTTAGASGSYELAMAASGSLVAAVWSDDRAGLLDVYANFSLDGGATWQPQDYRLDSSTVGTSDSQAPTVWVTTGAIHVAWVDHRTAAGCPAAAASGTSCANGDIYYRRIE